MREPVERNITLGFRFYAGWKKVKPCGSWKSSYWTTWDCPQKISLPCPDGTVHCVVLQRPKVVYFLRVTPVGKQHCFKCLGCDKQASFYWSTVAGREVLAVLTHPLPQIIFVTNAWVAAYMAGIIQTMLPLPLGKERSTHPAWAHACLFPGAPKTEEGQTHILAFKCLSFSVLHLNSAVVNVTEYSPILGRGPFVLRWETSLS